MSFLRFSFVHVERMTDTASQELNNRASFIDFCQGLLNLNPVTRWTPQQARLHPFITGEKFTKPFVVRCTLPFSR